MKKDLTTNLIAAVIGIAVAYFIANLLLPEIGNVSIKTLSGNTTYSLTEPSDEIFNYRAVNPTVEVYVGQCTEYNEAGECIDNGISTNTEESADASTENSDESANSAKNVTENSENSADPNATEQGGE